MSYSFQIKAATPHAAKVALADKFAEIVGQQPNHACDQAGALANASSVIDLLALDDTKDISVSANGYVSWSNKAGEEPKFTSVSMSATAVLVDRPDPVE